MPRNAAVRLSIASSVALVLLFLGGAAQLARQKSADAAPPQTISEIVANESTGDAITPEEVSSNDDDAAKVRRATVEWVKEHRPDAKVDGVFMLAFAKGNLYFAGADCKFDGDRHETLDVLVRRYTRRGGSQYFRAEGLGKEEADRLREKADFDGETTEAANTNPSAITGDTDDDDDVCRR